MEIPYNRSFAVSTCSIFWSPRNHLKPNEVYLKSYLKFWFICPDCNHEFEQILYVIHHFTFKTPTLEVRNIYFLRPFSGLF